jgi:peptide-methionine (S)-S-oxide reductase
MISPTEMPTRETALPDRPDPVKTDKRHKVTNRPLKGPFPKGSEMAMFAMGCFWGSEAIFWNVPGVWVTAVGYSGGFTANPTYDDVKAGKTGHAEVVRLVFDPKKVSYEELLKHFWEGHNPTEGMKQGEDVGSQYRSAVYYYNESQKAAADLSKHAYQADLIKNGFQSITTEIQPASEFYFAEAYHQAYFHGERLDYCVTGTGVKCDIQPRRSEPSDDKN